MKVHYHKKGKPVTVYMDSKVFRLQDGCECCGEAQTKLFELHGAYLCKECYGETMAEITVSMMGVTV
jgi:hypothetical protein